MSEKKTAANAQQIESARNDLALMPPVDVFEDASGITLYADMPGVPRDKLALQVDDQSLTIEGEVALDLPEGIEFSHREVSLPRYRRVFSLSKELDSEKVVAELNQGMLKLRIPKAEHIQPRRIKVDVA